MGQGDFVITISNESRGTAWLHDVWVIIPKKKKKGLGDVMTAILKFKRCIRIFFLLYITNYNSQITKR